MGWFGRKKEVIDFSEGYKRKQEKSAEVQNKSESSSTPFSIFGGTPDVKAFNSVSTQNSEDMNTPDSPDERKKKLAKRLIDITNRLEDLSNQIYHLQQRVDVIEQKIRVGVGG